MYLMPPLYETIRDMCWCYELDGKEKTCIKEKQKMCITSTEIVVMVGISNVAVKTTKMQKFN